MTQSDTSTDARLSDLLTVLRHRREHSRHLSVHEATQVVAAGHVDFDDSIDTVQFHPIGYVPDADKDRIAINPTWLAVTAPDDAADQVIRSVGSRRLLR